MIRPRARSRPLEGITDQKLKLRVVIGAVYCSAFSRKWDVYPTFVAPIELCGA